MEGALKKREICVEEGCKCRALADAEEIEYLRLLDLLLEFGLPHCLGNIISKFLDGSGICDYCQMLHPFSEKCTKATCRCCRTFFCGTCNTLICKQCTDEDFEFEVKCCNEFICGDCARTEVWSCFECSSTFHEACMLPNPARCMGEDELHCDDCYDWDASEEEASESDSGSETSSES